MCLIIMCKKYQGDKFLKNCDTASVENITRKFCVTLETSALKFFTMVNSIYQPS